MRELIKCLSVVTILITQFLQLSDSFKCRTTAWSHRDKDVSCAPSEFELYREGNGIVVNRRCCSLPDNGHNPSAVEMESWNGEVTRAKTCKILPCQNVETYARSTDICSTLPPRVLRQPNGRQRRLLYREESREPCVLKDGQEGALAVCCPDSLASAMLAAYQAEPFEFPYIAHIYNSNTTDWCGAAIYNEYYLITASHCVVNKGRGETVLVEHLSVLVGSNIALIERRSQHHGYHKVADVYPHPGYSGFSADSEASECRANDIAVLKLKTPLTFSSRVQPIEIAPEGFDPLKYGYYAFSAGWGILSNDNQLPYLRKHNLKLRTDDMCFRGVGATNSWSASCDKLTDRADQFLCLGGLATGEGNSDEYPNPLVLSPGFSGGPVVCRGENGRAILCGIVSSGGIYSKCIKERNESSCPFTRASEIAHFRKFIMEIAEGQKEEDRFNVPIFGSELVSPKEFPHQVYIYTDPKVQKVRPCGGTLVTNDTVITAGHCVVELNQLFSAMFTPIASDKIKVLVGSHDVTMPQYAGDVYSVKSVHVSPQFTAVPYTRHIANAVIRMFFTNLINPAYRFPVESDGFFHDLAILKLSRQVNIPDDKLPIVPNLERTLYFPPSISATGLAYARTNTKDFGKLLKHDMILLGSPDCKERAKRLRIPAGLFPADLYCLVDKHSGGSVCDRELGGGIVRKTKGGVRDVLVGVYAFRACQSSLPNGAVNVGMHSTWIDEIMQRY